MTDDHSSETISVPAWYWIVAVGALLFELAGAYLYANSLTLDPASLPLDQRAIYEATPQWMTIAWGIAIASGVAGAVGLLLRMRFAQPLLLVSLIAVAVQFSGIFLVRQLRELTPENHLIVPVVILLLAYGVWQTSKLAQKRGWLR
ncbi:MAG TPA: hypothetical protein VFO12_04680 [Sphingomicrobium sp.]|nr:hypothetical protein [Sphingomicrobium sp.]